MSILMIFFNFLSYKLHQSINIYLKGYKHPLHPTFDVNFTGEKHQQPQLLIMIFIPLWLQFP